VGLGGAPLALGKRTYRRGLLLVPTKRLRFELPRAYRRFQADVGIPAARYGTATLRVLADGTRVGEPLHLRAGQAPVHLDLALSGARELTLIVEAGDSLDTGARVILGDARVVVD